YDGVVFTYHSTFNVGLYDSAQAGLALQKMHLSGYNTVRVFLNGVGEQGLSNPSGGLSTPYVANVADFLRLAAANEMLVIVTEDFAPFNSTYIVDNTSTFQGNNNQYLTTPGVEGKKRFWQDFIMALTSNQAPLSAIFAYELTNEF